MSEGAPPPAAEATEKPPSGEGEAPPNSQIVTIHPDQGAMAAPSGPPATTPSSGPPSANAARALLNRVNESVKHALAQQRPWHELVDRNSFAKPESLAEASNRIKKNLSYFRVNYGIVLVAMVAISILWSPFSILCLALLGGMWFYVFMVRVEPLVIYGRVLSEREKFIALVAVTILIMFGLTKTGAVLLSGIIIGSAAVAAHGAFRVPDDLFLDDQDAGGFLSFLGPPAGNSQLPASIGHV